MANVPGARNGYCHPFNPPVKNGSANPDVIPSLRSPWHRHRWVSSGLVQAEEFTEPLTLQVTVSETGSHEDQYYDIQWCYQRVHMTARQIPKKNTELYGSNSRENQVLFLSSQPRQVPWPWLAQKKGGEMEGQPLPLRSSHQFLLVKPAHKF